MSQSSDSDDDCIQSGLAHLREIIDELSDETFVPERVVEQVLKEFPKCSEALEPLVKAEV